MRSSVNLLCVDPKQVEQFWPHVSHFIAEAMERGGLGDFEEVEWDVLHGASLLWIAWDGEKIASAAVTSLGAEGENRICTIVACGGDEWLRFGHLIEGLENYAKQEGCKAVRIYGRPGWQRVLSGYRTKQVVIEKVI